MEFAAALAAFQLVGEELARGGLVTSHGGNLSLRFGSGLLITKHGSMLGRLQGRDLVVAPLDGAAAEASWDLPWHQAVYRAVPTVQALVHAHPLTAVALSLTEERLRPADKEGGFLLGEVPVLEDDAELIGRLAEALSKGRAALVRGHGSLVGGASLEEALHLTTTLEASAQITLRGRLWSGEAQTPS